MRQLPAEIEANPVAWADRAKAQIAQCESLDQAQEMDAQAKAVHAYLAARAGRFSEEAKALERLTLLTTRRVGELLPPKTGPKGGRPKKENVRGTDVLDRRRAAEARALATLDEAELEAYAEERHARKKPASIRGAVAVAKKKAEAPPTPVGVAPAVAVATLDGLAEQISSGERDPFACIYADPPWPYKNQGTRGATGNVYKTAVMSLDDIRALPVGELAAERAHLHLWTTKVFLPDAFSVVQAWGFDYKSVFTWVKPQLGLGNYWRSSSEFMLLATRGQLPFAIHDAQTKDWREIPRKRHSAKPDEIRRLIEEVSPGPRLELFARVATPGWWAWGDEVEGGLFSVEVA